METIDLRKTVIDYVKSADERLLNVIKAVVESYQENDVVAFTVNGKPLTKYQYEQILLEAESEIENGNSISPEALEKESNEW
ncbi:hypothetical protein [Gelidibacter sp.]|uniref:hypothetical protein n=1 Tax=Gelidibacter sp. TaxID=2018083 RepID=UPI003265F04D